MSENSIITVGFCPSWDILCEVDGIEWGQHKKIKAQTITCAGKAFNISRALAWLGVENTAAGLWGQSDYKQMLESIEALREFVNIKLTAVAGNTRRNITLVDTQDNREMHLRAESKLANSETLKQLKNDLNRIVSEKSIVVFAGAMPGDTLIDECVTIVSEIRKKTNKVAVDTYGDALKKIVELTNPWLIKPNLDEISELLGEQVEDETTQIIKASRKLLGKTRMVLVSRGPKGAILVTEDNCFEGNILGNKAKSIHTVGCGDYLLAGFLAGLKKTNISDALSQGIKVATARAWGWCEKMHWLEVESKIKVDVRVL